MLGPAFVAIACVGVSPTRHAQHGPPQQVAEGAEDVAVLTTTTDGMEWLPTT